MQDDRWFVGVDWAMQKHQVCLVDGEGAVRGERVFEHDGKGLAGMAAWLVEATGVPSEAIGVAIETPHGPVVESLMGFGFAVHSINPKQLDRFRDRFSPAGAKDDRRDARVLADALRTDPHSLRRVEPTDPLVVELRGYTRTAEDLSGYRTGLANRMRQLLWSYFPQIMAVCDDVSAPWILELWGLAPTPEEARRLRKPTVAGVLKRHRIRRIGAEEVVSRLREPTIPVAPGTAEAAVAQIRLLAAHLKLVRDQRVEVERNIERLLADLAEARPGQSEEQRDVPILFTYPGVGKIVLATLLAEGYELLLRRDYHALRCLSGVAPVTQRSGKKNVVVRRLAASRRLREAVYHWARVAVQHDPASKAKYQALRARGKSHGRALRTVGDRLLAVACTMLRNQTEYDPNHARCANAT